MKVIQLTNHEQQKYSEFVDAHESGSFLQSWSWGEFQKSLGKDVIRYVIINDSGAVVASAQLFLTKVPYLPGFYLYVPYGPLIISNEHQTEIVDILISHIERDFPNSWFIRFEPKSALQTVGKPTVHIQPGSTLITDISLPEEDILAEMHHKTRYNIKVAAKHGVTVRSQIAPSIKAINLLHKTSERQGYKSYPAKYYTQLLTFFENNTQNADSHAILYEAMYQTEIIASAIMIDHRNTRTYLFGGSNDTFKQVMGPYALHWHAIIDAKTAGLKNYDWWGIETATGKSPGFVQFKMRWGGIKRSYPQAQDIVLHSAWYCVYKIMRAINRFL